MDAAGLIIGIPGLIRTCVHGYRFVCEMIDLDKNVAVLRLRYRIEESRLVLWGRYWGVLMPGDDSKVQSSAQSLDDLLEIPGIEALIMDILQQILVLLQETQRMSQKYDSTRAQNQSLTTAPSRDGAPSTAGQVSVQVQIQTRTNKHSTSAKLRWALKDKSTFESVLASLTSLNDGLDKLLPRHERIKLGRALVGEVLSEEGIAPGGEGSDTLAIAFDRVDNENEKEPPRKKAQEARMMNYHSLEHYQRLELDEDSTNSDQGFEDLSVEEDAETEEEQEPPSSMQLSLEWFINLTGQKNGFSMETLRRPTSIEAAAGGSSEDDLQTAKTKRDSQPGECTPVLLDSTAVINEHEHAGESQPTIFREEPVFVEWRSYEHTIAQEQLQMALDARREQLSRFFCHEPKEDSHYVMQCLGFVLFDKTAIGLVFSPPPNFGGPPISLNEMIRADFESPSAVAPDLEDRIRLAKKLSTALYQLQCAGWLHRKISSYNIMFFPVANPSSEGGDNLNLSQPFLTGWQTARYDDQVFKQHSEGTEVWRRNPFLQQELPYIHPSRPAARTRFKRSFDVYSMGVVLAEIAFWE
jgi:hypothetical protein